MSRILGYIYAFCEDSITSWLSLILNCEFMLCDWRGFSYKLTEYSLEIRNTHEFQGMELEQLPSGWEAMDQLLYEVRTVTFSWKVMNQPIACLLVPWKLLTAQQSFGHWLCPLTPKMIERMNGAVERLLRSDLPDS